MVVRVLLLFALVGGLLTAPGCGGSSGSSTVAENPSTTGTGTTEEAGTEEDGEEASTPEEALAEIRAIRPLLADAVALYKTGDHEAAADAVGDIYLEHFEKVEVQLGEQNHDLMEELEEKLSTDLRTAMREGRPDAEIQSLADEIDSELDEAEAELR